MKSLNLSDIPQNYQFDIITCYEHPIAVALHSFDEKMCNSYIMLAKLYGMYQLGDEQENRKIILEQMRQVWGVKAELKLKFDWKGLSKVIDNGEILIVGVDLYEVFYSTYYQKEHWGHWFLIQGYDKVNQTVQILDNTHFQTIGQKYDNFRIPYSLIKKAFKGYKKQFGEDYACMVLAKDGQFDYQKVLEIILQKYCSIDLKNTEIYRQIKLFNEISKLVETKTEYAHYYIDLFKKKIININKYRTVFFKQIENSMEYFRYDDRIIQHLNVLVTELLEKWKLFTLQQAVKVSKGAKIYIQVPDEIVNSEKVLQQLIEKYAESLKTRNSQNGFGIDGCKDAMSKYDKRENRITYEQENNQDEIIYGSNEKIVFEFKGNKIYNWWLEDKAPKICLVKTDFSRIHKGEDLEIKTKMIIDIEETDGDNILYQAGLYIKTDINEKSYMCALSGKEHWSVDIVGYEDKKMMKDNIYFLYIRISKGRLQFGKYQNEGENQFRQIIFERDIISEGVFQAGLVCKTWGIAKKLKVQFLETNVEYV